MVVTTEALKDLVDAADQAVSRLERLIERDRALAERALANDEEDAKLWVANSQRVAMEAHALRVAVATMGATVASARGRTYRFVGTYPNSPLE